jgi:AraC family transcriptional regulator, transcriptional activator of pobA
MVEPMSIAANVKGSRAPLPAYRSQLHANASARVLEAALYPRRYALSQELEGLDRATILLLTGSATVSAAGETHELNAPALLWMPVKPDDYLRVSPGSAGSLLVLSSELAKESIGQNAEAVHLRYLVDRLVAVESIQSEDALDDLRHSFNAVLREIKREERGSWNFLSAHIALILIHCWRLTGCEDLSQQGQGASSSLLLRFRHLVELHFRAHWTVAQYASSLGISADRLHDLCTRSLQHTPLELLHDRVIHEAKLRLVRSGLTIEQVADNLGFKSATHFSRFFRRETGLTPAGYRREAHGPAVNVDVSRSYADWP